jgi:hypothetical protein
MTAIAPMPEAGLEHFLDRLRTTNPFLANRVDRPWADDLIDVADIHEAEFQRLTALALQACREDRGIGAVVWGEAGIGKSHLLTRLGRWARTAKAPFIYLHNLQASPERLPRFVLRATLGVLTNGRTGPWHKTPLFTLVNGAVKVALQVAGQSRGDWRRIATAYGGLVDRLAGADPSHGVLFDRTVYDIFFHFFWAGHPSWQGQRDAEAGLALRWLAGDALTAEEAHSLGLSSLALEDNQHVKQVFVALTRLARLSRQVFLLCFDQVDNLDEAQLKSLTRFLHDLLDSAGNLLVVTTGVQQTMLEFQQRGVITETSWDRVGQIALPLKRIRQPRGQELLWARLQHFLKPSLAVTEVGERVQADALFPLGTRWVEQRVGDLTDVRPRDLLTWAGERWHQQQDRLRTLGGPQWLEVWQGTDGPGPLPPSPEPDEITAAIDRRVEQQRADECERRRDPAALPPSEDNLGWQVYTLLQLGRQGGSPDWPEVRRLEPPKSGARSPYDLLVGLDTVGVRFLVAEHGNRVTPALRLLIDDADPPDRVVLVTDERQPLPLGPEGRRRLEQLRQRATFRHFELKFTDYGELDALHAVLAAARAGDLDIELPAGPAHLVSEADVIASYHRLGCYQAHPLLRELLGGEMAQLANASAGVAPTAADGDKEVREFIVAQVALEDGLPLRALAERYADRLRARDVGAVDASGCLARLQEVAARLAGDGLLRLTADGQRLSLVKRS